MKILLLFLAGMFLFTGCNNLNSVSYPNLPLPPGNSISGGSNGFWVYEGEQVPFGSEGITIQCLSISGNESQGYMVRLWISYSSSSAADEYVELYTVSPNNSRILSAPGNPELILLQAEKSAKGARARLNIMRKFLS